MVLNISFFPLHIAAIFILLLCGIYIVSVRGFRPPIIYLSIERFLLSILFLVNLFQTSHTPAYGLVLWNPLLVLMILTYYPFLFAYIFSMLRPGSLGVRYWLLAYVPVAVFAILYFILEALFGKMPFCSTYAEVRHHLHLPQLWVLFAAAGFSVAMMSVYTVRAIRMLQQHKRNLESNFSFTEGSTLGWMWWAIAITLIKWLFFLVKLMIEGNFWLYGVAIFDLEPIIITILVLRQKDLYSMPEGGKDVIPERTGEDSELSQKKRKILECELLALLNRDEVFRDPELSNEKVRDMLGTNRTYLWLVITRDMNTTFYKLINARRLDMATTMMKDPRHRKMPLRNIAEICGFKSLGAFSFLFKQMHGKTPTQWRTAAHQERSENGEEQELLGRSGNGGERELQGRSGNGGEQELQGNEW